MDENLHYYKLSALETKQNNQNKVICTLLYCSCFNLLCFILKFCFIIGEFFCANLLTKRSYFKNIYNFEKPLSSIIANKSMLKSLTNVGRLALVN
jgi:maltodextrin utilization protein YvdJ